MHVRFTAPFLFTPKENRQSSVEYPAGSEGSVRRDCGEAAIAAGKAVEIAAPTADEAAERSPRKRRAKSAAVAAPSEAAPSELPADASAQG